MTTDREGYYLDRCVYEADEHRGRLAVELCPDCGEPMGWDAASGGAWYCGACDSYWTDEHKPACPVCLAPMAVDREGKAWECPRCGETVEANGWRDE